LRHSEFHRSQHIGWLRAAVLGANDGIVSTASLIIGVAAAHTSHEAILLTGVAGLVSGAMSMAAGEYVSVSSQSDTEAADLTRERLELATDQASELKELTNIYIGRGLTPDLAYQVAVQFTAHDALGAHARDELGIIEAMNARPVQAAFINFIYRFHTKHRSFCSHYVIGTFGHFRRISSKSWWCKYMEGYCSCSVLGGACNGCNGWRRQSIWSSCYIIITSFQLQFESKTKRQQTNDASSTALSTPRK
jgi:hypothetical protein